MLFYAKSDETEQERISRLQFMEEFKKQYFKTSLGEFSQETGILINNLSLREQVWVCSLFRDKTEEKKLEIIQYTQKYKEPGIRCLSAIEYGAEWGDRLIRLTELLSPDEAKQFINAFDQIITMGQKLGDSLRNILEGNESIDPNILSNQIIEALMRKNKDFIVIAEEVVKQNVNFSELIHCLKEYCLILEEISSAIDSKEQDYSLVDTKQEIQNNNISHVNWIFMNQEHGYQVNLLVRPSPALTVVTDKKTGERKKIMAQAGIRATFVWPNKRRFGIRLDLDPYYQDEEFPQGRLTLDIGGRDSQIGELLNRVSESGYHNSISFSPELSDPLTFRAMCLKIIQNLQHRFANPEPLVGETD